MQPLIYAGGNVFIDGKGNSGVGCNLWNTKMKTLVTVNSVVIWEHRF